MAFPVIETTNVSATVTAGTDHIVTLPTGIAAGDLILIVMSIGSTAATLNAHADYTELLDENSAVGLKILYRWATGGEGDPTFVSNNATRDATCSFRISGAMDPATQPPEIGTTATASSANPDPPSLDPAGASKDFLFITFCGSAGEQADNGTYCTAFPTNYNLANLQKTCGVAGTNLGGMIAAAARQLTTAGPENPGTFTVSETNTWRAQTIAIHPSGVTTVSGVGQLASAESFGTPKARFMLEPVAIASSETVVGPILYWVREAFGRPTVSVSGVGPSTITVYPQGFEDDDDSYQGLYLLNNDGDFGLSQVVRQVRRVGAVASTEAFGTARATRIVGPTGVASSEAVGRPTLVTSIIRGAGAIPSAEAFGTSRVRFVVIPAGIASAQAFGTARVLSPQYVSAAGAIASAEVFGQADRLRRVVGNVGAIASSEAVGRPSLGFGIYVVTGVGNIASAEAFGTARLRRVVGPTGIASSQAFGKPSLVGGIQGPYTLDAVGGISSAEAFGQSDRIIRIVGRVGGIASSEAFGIPQAALGVYFVTGVGKIASAEAFGQSTRVRFVVGTVGIASAQAFGRPSLVGGIQGPYTVSAVGAIPSAETFGLTHVLFIVRRAGAIGSAQAFGTAQLARLLRLTTGISSAEAFGQTDRVRRVVGTLGIVSGEAFGTPTKSPQILWVAGVGSSEAFGTPYVFDATIKAASGYGAVVLSDVAVFLVAIADRPLAAADISDATVFAGALDDRPGG